MPRKEQEMRFFFFLEILLLYILSRNTRFLQSDSSIDKISEKIFYSILRLKEFLLLFEIVECQENSALYLYFQKYCNVRFNFRCKFDPQNSALYFDKNIRLLEEYIIFVFINNLVLFTSF